ncbi:hypothetical protein HAZT_HAZT006454 [Hyalella azteca]|uniref:AAA+ ATPase domain-containing protein n=1 Tax=Hyalella azteca TaxID=294128 RepID=A0A6A0HDT7_HYAAZ|nr:hypothetical protein HAZT_HAZT006454 [Hyalella azteca]
MMMNGFGSSSPSTDIDAKEVIHVEILKKRQSSASNADLENALLHHLTRDGNVVTDATLTEEVLPVELRCHIISVRIIKDDTTFNDYKHVNCSKAELQFHTYSLEDSGPDTEELPGTEDDHQEPIPAATQWLLPSTDFHNLWDNLIFDSDIKNELLSYVSTALMFSDCGINPNIISWNRVVLLHGPPGTGKTSLCRALAHQLSIRLGHRYSYAQLIEINSHSLFSKWFSESGKLVQRLFSRLQEMADDPSCLVCVLVDEVESLARSRCSESASSEPGDAVRVVNALLTQLDHIKRSPHAYLWKIFLIC